MMHELENIIVRAEVLAQTNWIQALHILEQATEEYPQEKRIFSTIGDILARRKQYKKAIDSYQKALIISPNDIQLIFTIGNCYFSIDEFRMSLIYYDKISNPTPDVLYNKALALAYLGMFSESIIQIKCLLQIYSDNIFIYFLLIEQLMRIYNFDEAAQYIEKAEQKFGKHKHLLVLKGIAYAKKKNWLKAYTAFNENDIAQTMYNVDYLHTYAISAWNIGLVDKALELLRRALNLNPSYQPLYEDFVRILLSKNKIQEAYEMLQLASEHCSELSEVLKLLKIKLDTISKEFV